MCAQLLPPAAPPRQLFEVAIAGNTISHAGAGPSSPRHSHPVFTTTASWVYTASASLPPAPPAVPGPPV